MTATQQVRPEDIRAKLSEIDTTIQSTKQAAAPIGIAVGAGAVVVVVALAYWWGKRRGRKRQTVVEIRRI